MTLNCVMAVNLRYVTEFGICLDQCMHVEVVQVRTVLSAAKCGPKNLHT